MVACWLCGTGYAASWHSGADPVQGLPSLSRGGTAALTSAYVFWGKSWAFSDQQTTFKLNAPFDYSITGKNPGLDFDLAAHVRKESARQMQWDFDLNARSPLAGIIGGGISFRFDIATFGPELGEPELLPGNLGWAWGRAGSNRVEMRFDHPLAAVYFERGQKNEVRAFFYKDKITSGRQHYVATLSLSGDVELAPTPLERYGPADYRAWPSGILNPAVAPVDLSFLNAPEAPAGKRGFLAARADALVFEDGTGARFWGTNLTASALFGTSKANVKQQAHRLSALGFNLVRIHHHDSDWVDPNIFGDLKSRGTHALDAAMLEKLDWWIKCLKEEGIYVWIDLQVGRRLLAADGITDFAEISKGGTAADLPGYNYVNDSIRAAMKRFDEMYLNHENRYTALRYKEDPAIAAILITNENDLTHHFGNALLPDKGVPKHAAIYMREARDFGHAHGLAEEQVWRAWEEGPSKIFLNDLEQRFDVDMIAHLRALGVRVPIVPTSSWGEDPLSSLPALTLGDLIDVHTYGGEGELEKNPQLGATLVDWMAAAHVAGKPVSVSEWGVDSHGSAAADRADMPLYVASSAALQGLSAVMFFAYSQEAFSDSWSSPSIFHAYNDPALMASLPAAALLFRQGHVREAATTYVFTPGRDLFTRSISPATSVALRTAAERGRLLIAMPQVPELPWLRKSPVPSGATLISDPLQSLLPVGAAEAVSDNHELRRNWDQGTFTIDTPRTQAAMGWIGGKSIALPDVDIAVSTRNAVVAVQSLDGDPISQSRSIMISIGARSVIAPGNSLPYYSEPVEGRLLINARAGLGLRAWSAKAGKMRKVSAPYQNGRYAVALDRSLGSSWLMLDAR
jgi:hypothetical protein